MGNKTIISSRVCRLCHVCTRKFYPNFFIIEYGGFDVIFGMDCVSTFHTILDCRKKSVTFQISNHPKFEFLGGSKTLEPAEFRARSTSKIFAMVDKR